MFHLAILHRYANVVLLIDELVSMVLNMAEDELNVRFVFCGEAFGVILRTLHGKRPCGPKRNFRGGAMYLLWLHTCMYVSRGTEIIPVKLILQGYQAVLMRLVIEVVLATQVLREGKDALHHVCGRQVVDVALQRLADVLQSCELVRVRQSDEAMPVRRPVALEFVCKG